MDYLTGAPGTNCGYADASGIMYQASARSTTAPPTAATVRVDLNSRGEIGYSALNIDAGAPPASQSFGTRRDIVEPVYWLEVPRDLHTCRHVDATTCQ
jgi:type IV pilus assembly protein PilY1